MNYEDYCDFYLKYLELNFSIFDQLYIKKVDITKEYEYLTRNDILGHILPTSNYCILFKYREMKVDDLIKLNKQIEDETGLEMVFESQPRQTKFYLTNESIKIATLKKFLELL